MKKKKTQVISLEAMKELPSSVPHTEFPLHETLARRLRSFPR